MKVTVPATEVEICDVCHREGYLQTCLVCGGQFCLMCKALVPGCVHQMQVCLKCGKLELVRAIADKHAPLIQATLNARDDELRTVGQKREQRTQGADSKTD